MTNAEAQFNKSLRPRKPEGSLGRTAQDVHLDSHTAPELIAKIPIIKAAFLAVGQVHADLYSNQLTWSDWSVWSI